MSGDEPILTILLFVDGEKPASYLRRSLAALAATNGPGLARAQVIAIVQREGDAEIEAALRASPVGLEIVRPMHPTVEGYPLWDILAEIRLAWPLVRGRYVSCHHAEYTWTPGHLTTALDWLTEHRPLVALGNLRRFGIRERRHLARAQVGGMELCQGAASLIDAGQWERLAGFCMAAPTTSWIYWRPEPTPDDLPLWREDVFFFDRGLWSALRLHEHGGGQPFQDVYDLIGEAVLPELAAARIAVAVPRIPREICTLLHFDHPRTWAWATKAMRDHFRSLAQYADTTMQDGEIWRGLMNMRGDDAKHTAEIHRRRNRGGTIPRYRQDLAYYMGTRGAARVRAYLDSRQPATAAVEAEAAA